MTHTTRALLVLLSIAAVLGLMASLLSLLAGGTEATTPASIATKGAIVSLRVDPTKSDGSDWDLPNNGGSTLPDPAVCVIVGRKRTCYPAGKDIATTAACQDTLFCHIRDVTVPSSGAFRVEVWDVDLAAHDKVCEGECTFGRVCNFKGCAVAVGDAPTDLRPGSADSAGGTCEAAPLDAARLARLVKNPASERQVREREKVVMPNEVIRAWEYEMPGCSLLWLQKSDERSWAITCHNRCPGSTGLGMLNFVVESQVLSDDKQRVTTVRWHEITDGPLKGHFASLVSVNGAPEDLSVESAESIRRGEFPAIARWICENRNFKGYEKPCASVYR